MGEFPDGAAWPGRVLIGRRTVAAALANDEENFRVGRVQEVNLKGNAEMARRLRSFGTGVKWAKKRIGPFTFPALEV